MLSTWSGPEILPSGNGLMPGNMCEMMVTDGDYAANSNLSISLDKETRVANCCKIHLSLC